MEVNEQKQEKKLLDLYSYCGGMYIGMCIGADVCCVKLVTKWTVDLNRYACDSLKVNHPKSDVRNESAEDFLLVGDEDVEDDDDSAVDDGGSYDNDEGEYFEVEEILEVSYGDPKEIKKVDLYLKVHWKGYDLDEDT
ncbi:hypothetical protein RDI58_013304 [Solanum bulbocastanum]|uniref:Chromo domain-containing protein n=1 Tax=Solanum bulbocastanum TaxID=147425 RepID=A0AAN8YDV8_SOLBU